MEAGVEAPLLGREGRRGLLVAHYTEESEGEEVYRSHRQRPFHSLTDDEVEEAPWASPARSLALEGHEEGGEEGGGRAWDLLLAQGQGGRAAAAKAFAAALLLAATVAVQAATAALPLASISLLRQQGWGATEYATMTAVGAAAYVVGKVLGGPLVDYGGGKAALVLALVGCAVCTAVFPLYANLAYFCCVWAAQRFVTALAWPAVVKVACAWFHYREYGRTLAVVSQGYLLAGACMRLALGAVLVLADDDWRLVFWASSAGAGVAALLVICCLRPGAESLRLERPLVDPQNVAGAAGDRERPERLGLLGGLLGRSPSFWLLVLFGLLVSIVRTQTVAWVALFFSQAYGLSSADAALASTVFGVAGGVSALLVGFLYDRLGFRGRAGLVADLLLFAAAGYLLLGTGLLGLPAALLAMAFVGLTVNGPFSLPTGALSAAFGGKKACGTVAALVDAGGSLADVGLPFFSAWLVDSRGYSLLWALLGCLSAACAGVAVAFFFSNRVRAKALPTVELVVEEHSSSRW